MGPDYYTIAYSTTPNSLVHCMHVHTHNSMPSGPVATQHSGSRDQRTPGDQIVTAYLHVFNVLALNGITQLHTSHRNHSVQACFSLLLRPCKVHPLLASKTHCVPGVPPPVAATIPHATPTSLHEPMQRVQVYPHQCIHPQRLRARTSSSTFGTCQERLHRDRDKRVSPDHTHKQTPFACVCT